MVESPHAESGTYGRGMQGVFGQAVEGSLGRTGADTKFTSDLLRGVGRESASGICRSQLHCE